ncbi:hypothetical protein ASD12_18270 [Mesorhizobium sp. Root102]|uniref:DUF7666 domain-containing protein n=1 Tax=Mesorhizobium sp. Root102 TaxID=1736422 RepID=UPI000700956B|nr:hypothetical protein [Mesorhizobium sp. Root102]KQU77746.1 hypothetical protein ASD12_18270 [Mesorhizobium sp. Root102]
MARTKKSAAAVAADQVDAPIITYKGFNPDMTCRGFQYEFGKAYTISGEIVACERGFHACEHPLGVLGHYAPSTSIYAVTEQRGPFAREEGLTDTKVASAQITVTARIELPELIAAAVKYVFDRAKWISGSFAAGDGEGVKSEKHGGAATASGGQGAATASGDQGAATASGDQGAATASGYQGAATASGYQGAATASGDRGAATASGDQGAATASGYHGAATASGTRGAATASGWWGAATASGDQGAATASGDQGAATASGMRGAATASGWWGAATASGRWGAATASGGQGAATASGDHGAATASGRWGAATASGFEGKARGKDGCALFLVERSTNGEILHAWAGIAGRDDVKPDTFYRLVDGKPIEVA